MDKTCIETVRLLLEAAPAIFETPAFAMKGGTAINLFVQDMPRLSVDIDVVYADHKPSRKEALQSISMGLETTRRRLVEVGLEADVLPAMQWKLQNLAELKKTNPRKFAQQAEELRARFGL